MADEKPRMRRAVGHRVKAEMSVWTETDGTRIHVDVTVAPGWYVYQPGASDGLPVSMSLISDGGSRPLSVQCSWIPSQLEEPTDGHLAGRFTIDASLDRLPASARVQLRLQACDGRTCERPEVLTFTAIDVAPVPVRQP